MASSLENRDLNDPEQIEKALCLGEFIRDGVCIRVMTENFLTNLPAETLALYSLKKYRHLKRAYTPSEHSETTIHDPIPAT